MSFPSEKLPTLDDRPKSKRGYDPEGSHIQEDEALWSFVFYTFGFCGGDNEKEQHLRKMAKEFIDWDMEHSERTRWYS